MKKIISTPFNEYREEQSGIKLTDYFVRPDYFDQLGDNKPKMIYGSRGTGKTTLLKALAIEQADDVRTYIEKNDYVGFYYRTDLNVAGIFGGEEMSESFWIKLYSYYFVCSMSYLVFQQIERLKEILQIDEKTVCREISLFFNFKGITSFNQLISEIKKEERNIEIYLNNIPYKTPPYIGAYSSLLRDIPKIISDNSNKEILTKKHFIYMIDEFESLRDYQQKAILSLMKYADQNHTYIIGLRPLGLKVSSTVGDEYIRETDDYSTYILDDANANYNAFALKVCNKRLELFYKKHFPDIEMPPTINDFFDPKEKVDEVKKLFEKKTVREEHMARVKMLLDVFKINDKKMLDYLFDRPDQFYLVLLRLIKMHKKERTIDATALWNEINAFKDMDATHSHFVHNYKIALVYYLCKLYLGEKKYYGFDTIVSLSGNTLRYLLEMCNEIFLRVYRDNEHFYENPKPINIDIQTEEINVVSKRRLEQIKAIPDFGPQMRQFMNAFGKIASLYHEDSRLAKWEANHFSIKPSVYSDDDITFFLRECVFRGVLVQLEDNKIKVKNSVGYDQYIYKMHPVYTPGFHISFRKKQKIEFTADEISTMIGNDTTKLNELIGKYKKEILSNKMEDIIEYLNQGDRLGGEKNGQMSIFDDFL